MEKFKDLDVCNIQLFIHSDVHVHQPWETIESFKLCEKKGRWNVLIPLSLVIHGLNTFGFTIANLVHTSITFKYLLSFLDTKCITSCFDFL